MLGPIIEFLKYLAYLIVFGIIIVLALVLAGGLVLSGNQILALIGLGIFVGVYILYNRLKGK